MDDGRHSTERGLVGARTGRAGNKPEAAIVRSFRAFLEESDMLRYRIVTEECRGRPPAPRVTEPWLPVTDPHGHQVTDPHGHRVTDPHGRRVTRHGGVVTAPAAESRTQLRMQDGCGTVGATAVPGSTSVPLVSVGQIEAAPARCVQSRTQLGVQTGAAPLAQQLSQAARPYRSCPWVTPRRRHRSCPWVRLRRQQPAACAVAEFRAAARLGSLVCRVCPSGPRDNSLISPKSI